MPPSSQAGFGGDPTAAMVTGLQFQDQDCTLCHRPHDDLLHAPAD